MGGRLVVVLLAAGLLALPGCSGAAGGGNPRRSLLSEEERRRLTTLTLVDLAQVGAVGLCRGAGGRRAGGVEHMGALPLSLDPLEVGQWRWLR